MKNKKLKKVEKAKITDMVFIQTTNMLKYSFKNIFIFEVLYKLFIVLLLRPLIGELIYITLKFQGYSVATNIEIKEFLLSPGGIIMVILSIPIMLAAAFFEFAVLIVFLYYGHKKRSLKLFEGIKMGAHAIPALYSKSSFFFAGYVLVIIPFLNVGISSSVLPALNIPNFISGEISKFTGAMLFITTGSIVAVTIILLFVFMKLFLAIPSMVLEHTTFYEAAKRSTALQKGMTMHIFRVFRNWAILFAALLMALDLIKEIGVITSSELIASAVVVSVAAVNVLLPPAYLAVSLSCFLYLSGCQEYEDITRANVHRFFGASYEFFKRLKQSFYKVNEKINSWGLVTSIKNKANESKSFSLFLSLVIIIIALFATALALSYNPFSNQQKLVIGHRGSIVGVENTAEAVLNAASQGADYAEIDILLSKDGVPMVIHDSNLKRLAGVEKTVYGLTEVELREITLKQNEYTGNIVTLDELCKLTKGKIKLLIEFKSHGYESANIVDEVVKIVEENGLENEAIYHTSEFDLLKELKEKRPDFKIGYIIFGKLGGISSSFLRDMPADFFTFEESIVNGNLVRKCHWVKKPIYVWTVNDQTRMNYFYGLNVDGIITDFPQKAKQEALNTVNTGLEWSLEIES